MGCSPRLVMFMEVINSQKIHPEELWVVYLTDLVWILWRTGEVGFCGNRVPQNLLLIITNDPQTISSWGSELKYAGYAGVFTKRVKGYGQTCMIV